MLKKMMSTVIAVLFMGSVLAMSAGCNTVHGIGADVERGGEKLQKEANERR